VLRILLELDGENVGQSHSDMGYLHTGIENRAKTRRIPKPLRSPIALTT